MLCMCLSSVFCLGVVYLYIVLILIDGVLVSDGVVSMVEVVSRRRCFMGGNFMKEKEIDVGWCMVVVLLRSVMLCFVLVGVYVICFNVYCNYL